MNIVLFNFVCYMFRLSFKNTISRSRPALSREQVIFPKVMWSSHRHGFGLPTRITRKPKSFTSLTALGRGYRMALSTHYDVLRFHHCGIHAWCTSCPWHAKIVRSCWEGDRDILLPRWLWVVFLPCNLFQLPLGIPLPPNFNNLVYIYMLIRLYIATINKERVEDRVVTRLGVVTLT